MIAPKISGAISEVERLSRHRSLSEVQTWKSRRACRVHLHLFVRPLAYYYLQTLLYIKIQLLVITKMSLGTYYIFDFSKYLLGGSPYTSVK